MALGNSTFTAAASGGLQQANASQLSRWIAQLGICTAGIPGTLLNPGDVNSLRALVGYGDLAEAGAFRMQGGQPCYLLPINPSIAGALGAVASAGSGNATVAASGAPHVPLTMKIILGGALGTMTYQLNVNGGNYGATKTSSATTPAFLVPGTFCTLTPPAGTYVAGDIYSVGINGVVTRIGTGAPVVTQSSSPVQSFEFFLSVLTAGGFGSGQLLVSPDGGPGPTGGGSTMGVYLIPANGQIVLPGTGVVLQIGQHVIAFTITLGGALGTMTMSYTIDGGTAVTGITTAPNSGANFVIAVPGTGVTLTFPPGTYIISDIYTDSALGVVTRTGTGTPVVTQSWTGLQSTDTYAFLTVGPGNSTSDLNTALTAAQNLRNVQFTGVHVVGLPSSAANAVAAQSTIDAAMQAAYSNNSLDWQAWCECPSSAGRMGLGDIVLSGGAAIADVADTDAVIVAARGADTNRTGIHAGTYRITSALTGWHPAVPLGWLAAWEFVRLDPVQDLSAVANGSLPLYIPPGATSIGRDESVTPALDAAQFNTMRTNQGLPNAGYFTITSGGAGWKICSTIAAWQDARAVRVLNVMTAQVRPPALQLMGSSPDTNPDGTIEEIQRRSWTTALDGATKRAVGLAPGGPFTQRQASAATATVLASSQLGVSPKQLNVSYFLQIKGFVSSEASSISFGGTIAISQ